jgi:peptide/nickel transport system substrate-binding protein
VLKSANTAVYTSRLPEMYMILFNHKDPQAIYLKEPAVRRALMFGLNRSFMINQALNGQAIIANGPILPESWAYYADAEKFSFNLETAKKLFKDAGYTATSDKNPALKKGDTAVAFELIYPNESPFEAIAQQIKTNWTALGVQVSLAPLSYDALMERLDQRSYQAALVDLNLSNSYDPDPYPFYDQAQMTGGQNYTQWDNRMASEFLEDARMTVLFADRVRLYRNFQVLFAQEMPAIPLFYPVYTYAIDKTIQGVQIGPLFNSSDRFATVTDWFLQAKKTAPPIQTATIGK